MDSNRYLVYAQDNEGKDTTIMAIFNDFADARDYAIKKKGTFAYSIPNVYQEMTVTSKTRLDVIE